MSTYFNETFENARKYYEKISFSCGAEKFDGSGFLSIIRAKSRTYHVDTIIDSDAKLVMMEIYPGICCSRESLSMVSEYIAKINAAFKSCTLHIEENGTIYIKAEQHFTDGPISPIAFRRMEIECIKILDAYGNVIEKVANMKLLTPEEADVEKVYDAHIKKVVDFFRDKFMESDNDDDEKSNEEIDRETEENLLKEMEAGIDEYEEENFGPAPKEKKSRKHKFITKRLHTEEKDEALPEKADFDSIISVDPDEDKD